MTPESASVCGDMECRPGFILQERTYSPGIAIKEMARAVQECVRGLAIFEFHSEGHRGEESRQEKSGEAAEARGRAGTLTFGWVLLEYQDFALSWWN